MVFSFIVGFSSRVGFRCQFFQTVVSSSVFGIFNLDIALLPYRLPGQ